MSIDEIRKRYLLPIVNNGCANCGTLAANAKKLLTGGFLCGEEFACSDSCLKELSDLGCPQELAGTYRPRPQEVLDHEFDLTVKIKAALDAATAERDALKARVEELEAGIVAHRAGIYGDKEPKCRYNRRLYALLDKEAKPC